MTSTHRSLRELGARHSLSNLSVHDLVEKFARHSVYAVFKYLASSSNLSTTTRCVNSSGLLRSSSRNYLQRNYSLRLSSSDTACKLSDLYKAGISLVIDTLIVTPIEDNNNLLNTINSHIKLRKLKEKHLEVREADALKQVDANRLESEAQLRKASEEEELAKTKKEKREKEAREREARLDSLLDSDDYCSDSSPDINPEDNSEDEEATTAKDLAREQKERLKALLNAKYNEGQSLRKSRDGNRILHSRRLIGAYILYFKELLSNNSRIFASVIGITRTQAIVLLAIIGHVHFKN
ncbi:hypothetical protein HBI90_245830 [Parastagonospora nodorum]|nr:hypothetical protein HBI90_245830 [Parastagonospora nodorum]